MKRVQVATDLAPIAGLQTSYKIAEIDRANRFATDWLDPAVRAGLGLPLLDA